MVQQRYLKGKIDFMLELNELKNGSEKIGRMKL